MHTSTQQLFTKKPSPQLVCSIELLWLNGAHLTTSTPTDLGYWLRPKFKEFVLCFMNDGSEPQYKPREGGIKPIERFWLNDVDDMSSSS